MKNFEKQFLPKQEKAEDIFNKTEKPLEGSELFKGESKDLVQERFDNLLRFEPSGDMNEDVKNFLEITGRKSYFESVKSGQIDAIKLMEDIKRFQEKSLDEKSNFHHKISENDPEFLKKNMFYHEIPELEIFKIDSIFKKLQESGFEEIIEKFQQGEDIKKEKLTAEDSPEIEKRIEDLPDELRKFFSRLDPETRRVVCSDEGLLERSNEDLKRLYGVLVEEIEKRGAKPLFDQFMEEESDEPEPAKAEEKEEKKEEKDKSLENREKQERIEKIIERIDKGFKSAKDQLFVFERQYDQLSTETKEKFWRFKETYPTLIDMRFYKRMRDAFADAFIVYDYANKQEQSMLKSLPLGFISFEQIDQIDNYVNLLLEELRKNGKKIEESLNGFELTVNEISGLSKIESPEKLKKFKKAKKDIEKDIKRQKWKKGLK